MATAVSGRDGHMWWPVVVVASLGLQVRFVGRVESGGPTLDHATESFRPLTRHDVRNVDVHVGQIFADEVTVCAHASCTDGVQTTAVAKGVDVVDACDTACERLRRLLLMRRPWTKTTG